MTPLSPLPVPRRALLRMGWGLCIAGSTASLHVAAARGDAGLIWRDTALPAFGTTVWLRAAHRDGTHASAALTAAALRIQAVEAQMSLYRDNSALVRLNHHGHLHDAPAELLTVLREALRVARASGGLFDPTVQPLWKLRFDAARAGRDASPLDLQRAHALVNWRHVHIDATQHSIRFARAGMAVTLNGIAQGYATDAAAAALRAHGIEHALVDAGEWQPMGHAPDSGPWRLGLQDPRNATRVAAMITADGRAVACSSDDKLAFTPDRREHHIVDPRTGRSPRALASVVVLAPTCALADALTKPLMMGSAHDAQTLARRFGVDVITIDKAGRIERSARLLRRS